MTLSLVRNRIAVIFMKFLCYSTNIRNSNLQRVGNSYAIHLGSEHGLIQHVSICNDVSAENCLETM
jgi:hypothetical protein